VKFPLIKDALIKQNSDYLSEKLNKIETDEGLNYVVLWDLNKKKQFKGSFEVQKAKAEKALKRKYKQDLDISLLGVETIEQADDFGERKVSITLEWAHTHTWGWCPTGFDNYGHETKRIGGCGYCKKSTATAEILNRHPRILKLLYAKKEDALKNNVSKADSNSINHKVLGYGSGYNICPRFEGGVGVSSHIRILEGVGLKMDHVCDAPHTDVYVITKTNKAVVE